MTKTSLESLEVRIESPCSLNYKDLDVVDSNCQFCTACNQFVYDFDSLTTEDFVSIYIANKGNVCIKKTEQKSLPLPTKKSNSWRLKLKYWLMSLLTMMGISSCSFFNTEEEPQTVETIEVMGKSAPIWTVWDSLRHDLQNISAANLNEQDKLQKEYYIDSTFAKTGDPVAIRKWIEKINN